MTPRCVRCMPVHVLRDGMASIEYARLSKAHLWHMLPVPSIRWVFISSQLDLATFPVAPLELPCAIWLWERYTPAMLRCIHTHHPSSCTHQTCSSSCSRKWSHQVSTQIALRLHIVLVSLSPVCVTTASRYTSEGVVMASFVYAYTNRQRVICSSISGLVYVGYVWRGPVY